MEELPNRAEIVKIPCPQFNGTELSLLLQFKSKAVRLFDLEYIKKGFKVGYFIDYKIEEGMKVSIEPIPDDVLYQILHLVRPFILQKEDTFLPKIINCIYRKIQEEQIGKYLDRQKDMFSLKKMHEIIKIEINGEMLNSDLFFHNWLNAFEYHSDKDKLQEIIKMLAFIPDEIGKIQIHNILVEKLNAIRNILYLVITITEKGKELMIKNEK